MDDVFIFTALFAIWLGVLTIGALIIELYTALRDHRDSR